MTCITIFTDHYYSSILVTVTIYANQAFVTLPIMLRKHIEVRRRKKHVINLILSLYNYNKLLLGFKDY